MDSRLKKLLQALVILAIFGFFAYSLQASWDKLPEYEWKFNYFYLVLSGALLLLMSFLTAYLYHIILKKIDIKLNLKRVIGARLISDMGRYVPGKIWLVLGRLYLFKKEGVEKSKVFLSMMIELPAMMMGGFLLFLATLIWWKDISNIMPQMMVLALLPILLIMMHPKFLNWIINFVLKIFKKDAVRLSLNYFDILKITLFYGIYWIVYGLAFAMLIHSTYPLGVLQIIQIMGIFPISWIIGYLAFITPGGLGVREGVLVCLLGFIMPVPLAIIFSIASRIWITAFEGIAALIALRFIR